MTRTVIAVVALSLMLPAPVAAQSGTWTQATAGTYNWSSTGNWQGGTVADGANNAATFTTANLTGPLNVTLDTDRTIGTLVFDNPTNTFPWAINGTTTLTLSNAAQPTIAVNNANLTSTVGVTLAGTQGLNKTGAGTLVLTGNNTITGGVNVSAGTLTVFRTATNNPLGNNTVTLAGGNLLLGIANSAPIATTGGYNQDVVRAANDPATTPYGTTAAVDGGNRVLYERGLNTANPLFGLPSGSFTSLANPAVTYQLQPFTGNNVVYLATQGAAGTLNVSQPQSYKTLSILGTSGGGASTVDVTLNFSDSSTSTYSGLAIADWFAGAGFALGGVNGIDRFNRDGATFAPENNGTQPRLFPIDITLTAADAAKTLTGITLTKASAAVGFVNVFGVSGSTGLTTTTAQNFGGNNVQVTGNASIGIPAAGASLGNLSIGANTLTLNGAAGAALTLGTVTTTGAATMSVNNTALTTGAVTVGGNSTMTLVNSPLTTGPISLNANLTVNADANSTANLGILSDGGVARTFTKQGAGTATLSAPSTLIAGSTVAVAGGTLNVTRTAAGSPIGNSGVTLSGGTLRLGALATASTPIATTGGYNLDVIRAASEPATAPYGTTGQIDTANRVLYERGLNTANPLFGVPSSRTFTSLSNPNVSYMLQPYTGNNTISFPNVNDTATLTLTTPAAYQAISILDTSGSGASTFNVVVNFTDSTTSTYTGLACQDWFNGTNAVIGGVNGLDRIDRTGATFAPENNATNPRMYSTDLFFTPADSAKTVASLTFTKTAGGVLNIFGISAAGGIGAVQDFSGNNLTVTANSTIDVQNANGVTVGNLTIGGQTLTVNGVSGAALTTGGITLTGNPTLTTNIGMLPGALNDGGTARTITKAGTGTLTLGTAATSLVAGTAVNVNGGTLQLNHAAALGPNAALTFNGGTLSLGVNATVGGIGGNNGTIALNGNALTLGGSTSATFGARLTDGTGPGTLVRAGTGTTTLIAPNTFTGGITINSGTIAVPGPGTLGPGAVTLAGGTLAVAPRVTNISGFGTNGVGWTPNGGATVANNVLTLTTNANNQARSLWNNNLVPTTADFTASFTYQAGTGTASPGNGITFTFQNDSRSLAALGGNGANLGYSGVTPSVATALNIFDTNTRGVNFFTNGAVTAPYIPVTPLNLVDPTTPGNGGNPINVTLSYTAATGNLALNMVEQNAGNTYSLTQSGVDFRTFIGSDLAFIGFTGGTSGNNASQTISNFSFTSPAVQATYANNVVVNAGSGPSTVSVTPTAGAPTITMGALTVNAGGILNVVPGTGSPANQAYGLNFGGTTLNGAATFGVVNNGTGTGTLMLGTVGGAGSLTKTGTGSLVLNNANTYSGGTTVSGGRLQVTNTTGSGTGPGPVTVNGGTLGGTGTVGGSVTLTGGGAIGPGLSVGQLNVGGGTTFAGGGLYSFEFSAASNPTTPGTTHDFINGTGALNITAVSGTPFIIAIQGLNVPAPGTGPVSYTIGTFAGGIPGFDASAFTFVPTGWFSTPPVISQNGNNLILTFTPVPEPAHVLLLGAAVAGLAGWRRRRKCGRVQG